MPNILDKKTNSLGENNDQITDTLDTLDNETNQQTEEKPETGLVGILGECLTFAPLLYEKFTKQKLPAMGGTLGEMQQSISQLVSGFQQINNALVTVVGNQNKIFQRIVNLKNNATAKILNLD